MGQTAPRGPRAGCAGRKGTKGTPGRLFRFPARPFTILHGPCPREGGRPGIEGAAEGQPDGSSFSPPPLSWPPPRDPSGADRVPTASRRPPRPDVPPKPRIPVRPPPAPPRRRALLAPLVLLLLGGGASPVALSALPAATLPAATLPSATLPSGVSHLSPDAGALPDSARVLRDMRRAQEDFERFRETRIPAELRQGGGRCDEPVGRLCLVYPQGAERPPLAPAPLPVQERRAQLLDALAEAATVIPGDDWIAGQRVRYLVEAGDVTGAIRVAESCQGTPWWCHALRGWTYHEDDAWVDAGEAFLDALETMPDRERRRWEGESFLLEREGRRFLDVSDPRERDRRRALLWRLSDPLFLVPGNDRWTAHMARLAQGRTLEDAWNAFGLPWDVDLEELLLRYGWALAWERSRGPQSFQQLTRNQMVARLDPDRRRYLPTGAELEAFPATEDDALRVLTGNEPSGYSPAYAPVIENLSSQTARFRRGSEMRVVHAFARDAGRETGAAASSPVPRDLRTALFLLPAAGPIIEDGPRPVREGDVLEGVWSAEVAGDTDWILSLEGWSRFDRRAWRTRRGLERLPVPTGPVAVSDPVFLDAEPMDLPETLDAALAHVLPTVRFEAGRLVRIGWEVYGIPEGSQARVALGLERAERSLARRLGEFFRVLEPPQPVVIRWDDAPPEEPGVVFRAVDLQLPALEAGRYDLFLEIQVDDFEPAVTRRRFLIGDPPR